MFAASCIAFDDFVFTKEGEKYMGNNWRKEKRSFPERLVNAWCDLGRFVIRYLYPDMTEEESAALDEPFYQEWLFIFYREEKRRFVNACQRFWKWFTS